VDSQPIFIEYEGYVFNAAEIRTVTTTADGIHIDYRYGGFTDMPNGTTENLLYLISEARKALAPF